MKTAGKFRKHPLAAAVVLALSSAGAYAQDLARPEVAESSSEDAQEIEEVVVLGRFISSSQQLVNERMNDAFATDLLGADTISRLGDATVAAALRRVPGLTLVQDKFVYIRGLGERYTTTTLNGAQIPSPDLTRNVIPLDVFPTSVVESLKVQKAYDPRVPANFGGGNVDIRTKGIPNAFTARLEFGLGFNSEIPSRVNTYAGGGDDDRGTDDGSRALSPRLVEGLTSFQGNFSLNRIQARLANAQPGLGVTAQRFQAATLNRQLAASLNRDIGIKTASPDPDITARASIANRFDLGEDWQLGFAVGGAYETDWRWRRTSSATAGNPKEENGVRDEATRSINIAGTANFGVNFLEDHAIEATALYLLDTDDETEVFDFFNENRLASSGRGFRRYRFEWEQREMLTKQIQGTHYLGADTKDRLPLLGFFGFIPEQASISWFYSDSRATTDIPNRVIVTSDTFFDRNRRLVRENVSPGSDSANYRFTALADDVEDTGWRAVLPFEFNNAYVEVSGGTAQARKVRTYRQTEFSLGFRRAADPAVLEGGLNQVFSDRNIFATIPNPDPRNPVPGSRVYANDLFFGRVGANTNSYLAATLTDAAFAQLDWTIADTWRIVAGGRWENYRQVSVPWNPYGFTLGQPQVNADFENPPKSGKIPPDRLKELKSWSFKDDRFYPSVGLTYMGSLWADTFQLRLGYSETAVRPDLREITASSYIDPITGDLTRGNPGVRPADVENIDLRAEWFFANSDSFSVTIFSKDIKNPIEFFEIPASDTTIAREILNAESAEIQGVEVEFLKALGFLGGWGDLFFVQGNFTYQWNRDLVVGANGGSVACENNGSNGKPAFNRCRLSGASESVVNLMIGFDTADSKHTASLIYNVFSERLFTFGRFGRPDAFEQPFASLDLTYFWYPTDRVTVQFKAQNLLDDSIEIERGGIQVFEEKPGVSYSAMFRWGF